MAVEGGDGCESRLLVVGSSAGGSEGCVCGFSAGEEVSACQRVSSSWHVARGGSGEGTGVRWSTVDGREAWEVD